MSELPASWSAAHLGDLIGLEMGQAPAGSDCNKDGVGTPFVKAGEFGPTHPVIREWTTAPLRFGKNGDVFLCVVGATSGKINFGIDCAIGRSVAALRPSEALLTEYLYHFLSTKVMQLRSGSTGSAQGVISKPGINSIPIPLPPLAEQKRIVAKIEELFSELEAGEESLRVARRQLGVYRQSLLKQAFAGHLTAKWRTQNPAQLESPAQLLARIQSARQARYEKQQREWESDGRVGRKPSALTPVDPLTEDESVFLRDLPDTWRAVPAEAIGDVQLGRQRSPKNLSKNYPTKYIRAANITESGLALDDILEMEFSPQERKTFTLQPGDIVLSEASGSASQVGKPAMWRGEITDCCFQNTVIRHRLFEREQSLFYLWLYRYFYLHGIFAQTAGGVGINHLSAGKFARLPVPLCSLPEQQEIVRLLDEQFEVIGRNERELDGALRQSAALRQAILQKAFTGRLVPQVMTDEPASELLSRLRSERESTGPSRRTATPKTDAIPALPSPDLFPEIVSFKPLGKTDLQAGIVALSIDRFGRRKQFLGHTNAEKVVHLADCLADLQLARQPVKDAAGPNDFKRAKEIEHRARMKGWFRVTKDGPVYHYHAGRNLPALLETTERTLGPKFIIIENLLDQLRDLKDTKAIEIFATVYAAWNNLLLRKELTSEEAIVTEARENWHARKLGIDRKRFFGAIAWMKQKGFVPNGTGRLVETAESR